MLGLGFISPSGNHAHSRWSEEAGAFIARRPSAPAARISHQSFVKDLSREHSEFRSPRKGFQTDGVDKLHRNDTDDNILLPKVRKGLGPNHEGDIIILIFDGTPRAELARIMGRLLYAGLDLKVRSVRNTVAHGRSESDYEEEGYDCCFGGCRCGTRDCCQARCIRRSALAKILPACVSNLDAESSNVDVIIFVGSSDARLALEEDAVARDCQLRSETRIAAFKDVIDSHTSTAPITPARRSFLILSAIERPEGEGGAGISIKDTKCIFRAFSQHNSTFLAHIVEGLFDLSGVWVELKRGNLKAVIRKLFGAITLEGMSTQTMRTLRFPQTRTWIEMETRRIKASRRSIEEGSEEVINAAEFSSSLLYKSSASFLESVIFGQADISSDEYIVHELRTHYGEEVAWFYAFQRHFIKALFWPALFSFFCMILSAIFEHFGRSRSSMQIKCLFGMGIILIWAPFHIAKWEQKFGFRMQS